MKLKKYSKQIMITIIVVVICLAILLSINSSFEDKKRTELKKIIIPQLIEFEKDYDWRSFRRNTLNNGFIPFEIKSIENNQDPFEFKTSGLIWSTPVIDDNENIFIGSADKYFYSLNNQGNLSWKFQVRDTSDALIDSAATLTDSGKIIVPGGDGYIYCLDKETGEKLWDFKACHATEEQEKQGTVVNSFEGNIVQGPNGLLYAGSDNGHLYALTEEGEEVWNFKTDMMIWSAPVFDLEGKWMAFGSLDRYLYLLNPDTGKLLDKFRAKGDVKASPVYNPENNLLFFGDASGKFYALKIIDNNNKFKLEKLWEFEADSEIYSSASYNNNKIVFGSLDGKLYCLDYEGNLLWYFNTFSAISSSPTITNDDVVIFGAKNGKIYALNFKTGERLWSYRTSRDYTKVNLDSSVAISKAGNIYAGSYNGNVYKLPFNFCNKNKNNNKCEFGGNYDLPDSDINFPENGELFLFESRNGNLIEILELNLAQPLKIKFLVFEDGIYKIRTAINPLGLKIKITPEIEIFSEVASDGSYINVFPKNFWEPNTEYQVELKGSYYPKTNWFIDRFKWFFLPKFKKTVQFHTVPQGDSEFFELDDFPTLVLDSLSLSQPTSLDTLIPAALDSQKFTGTIFGKQENEFFMILLPVTKKNSSYEVIPEPKRSMVLKGNYKGSDFKLRGRFPMSAMGGTFLIKDSIFSGSITNTIENGEIFIKTSCLSFEGNAMNYQIPLDVIDETCNHQLNLIALGTYEGKFQEVYQEPTLTYKVVAEGSNFITIQFDSIKSTKDEKIISIISYSNNIIDSMFLKTSELENPIKIKKTINSKLIVFENTNLVEVS